MLSESRTKSSERKSLKKGLLQEKFPDKKSSWGGRVRSTDKNLKNCSSSFGEFTGHSFSGTIFPETLFLGTFFHRDFFPGFFSEDLFSGDFIPHTMLRICGTLTQDALHRMAHNKYEANFVCTPGHLGGGGVM